MDRRTFLRNCALIAAGAVAADQLEIIERLAHSKVFASPFPNGRVGHIELLTADGFVARHVPWNGEPFYQLKDVRGHSWARIVVDQPRSPVSQHAARGVGLPIGGVGPELPAIYTVPWA